MDSEWQNVKAIDKDSPPKYFPFLSSAFFSNSVS